MFKYKVDILISKEEIAKKVKDLACEIDNDFQGKEVLLIGLLRGSLIFLSDLVRELQTEATLDFMVVSSYGNSMESSRDVRIIKDLEEDIKERNVIIVEDIIDTGNTLKKVYEMLMTREPETIKICTLLDKPERREVEINVDYVGFQIPDEFVVGYGIDFAQKHRTLPYIGIVKKEEE
ncbi:hypoxanthine phosphoribosyltransferase [Leptotrichia sp. OH3620_COT-345]|uniref:hypoxanthine phosphoribosyltransferase n=1 Tax=Leptotrichia sp. OH3620_COT-345 TaxID=2491048 RepID=UPI000F650437|nr:hypoxanthine phosphoribosyltransferase [Leptotrichia sp. OH3620_COT-345]RRD39143.1 hypoxanthine phosphoribosyltransferase [Leptotrichia sp. OH3620_COT-345]